MMTKTKGNMAVVPLFNSARVWLVACLLVMCGIGRAQLSDELKAIWATPKTVAKLAPHPRLYVSAAQLKQLLQNKTPDVEKDLDVIAAAAETGIKDTDNPLNYVFYLDRPIRIQGRLLALAIQWRRTNDRKYLEAAVKTVQNMRGWIKDGEGIQLWHGQYIAGVAIAYDLFYNDMTDDERKTVIEVGKHFLHAWLRVTGNGDNHELGESGIWWMYRISNWNPVCVSGAGMLALAMYEDIDEAQTVINRVQASIKPIFEDLEKTEGGWVEGLGYWNWTMHYISLFGISYERATGTQYADFRSDGFRKTLTFGTYFVPHRIACGFGDNQHGGISPSLFAAAYHLGYKDELTRLFDHERRMNSGENPRATAQKKTGDKVDVSYGFPQKLLITPPTESDTVDPVKNASKYYPNQGWGMIADQWPKPTIFAAVRGGICSGAHTHADLLSWHAVIGKEKMIHNIHNAIYEPTGFYGRATDVYERNPASKNTLFIAGVSAYTGSNPRYGGPASAKTTQLSLPSGPAILLDARNAFNYNGGGSRPRVVKRLFAVLGSDALLVLDRVESSMAVPVEARAHTDKEATFGEHDILLKGNLEMARMTFASDQKTVLRRAVAFSTFGRGTPPTVIRFQTPNGVRAITLATLLTPGEEPVALTVISDKTTVTVTAAKADWTHTLKFSNTLQPQQ